MLTASKHPQSNGLAGKFARTLKWTIKSSNPSAIQEPERMVNKIVRQYMNATLDITQASRAQLFRPRLLRPNLRRLESDDVVYQHGNDLRPTSRIVLGPVGNRMGMNLNDGSVHRRNVN